MRLYLASIPLALAFSLLLPPGLAQVRIHPDYPVESPDNLSPPIVEEPIYQCAQIVRVSGFVPGALVEVYANGVELLARVEPHFGFADIELSRSLDVGDTVSARQIVEGVTSSASWQPAVVAPLPELPGGLPPEPRVDAGTVHCSQMVVVRGVIPGAWVTVFEDGNPVGGGRTSQDYANVYVQPLSEGAAVWATQTVCANASGEVESQPSPDVPVEPVPDPFIEPEVDPASVIVGNDTVTLSRLIPGAEVRVWDDGNYLSGGIAVNNSHWVPLPAPIDASWRVHATQELCGTDASSNPVEPSNFLPAPWIVGPVCASARTVRIGGTILNATVVLLKNGNVIGMGGATGGELRLATTVSFSVTDTLSVAQYMGPTVSTETSASICSCAPGSQEGLVEEIVGSSPAEILPRPCGGNLVPLFQNTDPFDVLDMTLSTDFNIVNGEMLREDAQAPGILSYVDPASGNTVQIDCNVEARGHSRFEYCDWRPLKLRFDSDPNGTLLDGTGKVIKIVTHCQWVSAQILTDAGILQGTPAEDTRRLLQEYALYEVLDTLDSTALETRLVRLTYADESGNPIETRFAFFREREKRGAERCGLERLEHDEYDPTFPEDPTSAFQVAFHHKLLFSHDFVPAAEHNAVRMGDLALGIQYYMPYDFDLSGIIHPTYFKNRGWTLPENGERLIEWLETQDPVLARAQVAAVLEHEAEILQVLSNGPLDASGKARLRDWYDDHFERLRCFLD